VPTFPVAVLLHIKVCATITFLLVVVTFFALGYKQQFDSNLAICRIDCQSLISNPQNPQYINLNIYQQFYMFLEIIE
jgi:hypothetical protein